jgi:hypothetical protein
VCRFNLFHRTVSQLTIYLMHVVRVRRPHRAATVRERLVIIRYCSSGQEYLPGVGPDQANSTSRDTIIAARNVMDSAKPADMSRMDKRREPRSLAGQTVDVTVYADHLSTYSAQVRNASYRGLALFLPDAVKCGTALRVRLEDAILLGEAVHCRPEGEGYLVGVRLEQVLAGLADLARVVESFNQELRGEVPHTAEKRER